MNKKKKHLLLIILSLIITLLVAYCSIYESSTMQLVRYGGVQTGEYTNNIFSNNYTECIDIKFDFKYEGLKADYENLFQTADVNDGIRLEFANFSEAGTGALLIPCKQAPEVFSFNNLPTPNVWHSLEIRIIGNDLKVFLDDGLLGKKILKNPNIKLDNVAVGTGFSKSRPFSGTIKNFELRTYKYFPGTDYILVIVSQLLLVAIVLAVKSFRKIDISVTKWFKLIDIKFISTVVLPNAFIFGVIVRSTQHNIIEWQYIYYEYLLLVMTLLYYVWHKAELKNYAATLLLAGMLIFLKSFFLSTSYLGALSDVFLILSIIGIIQIVLSFLPKYCYICLHFLIAATISIVIGFLTMAMLYVHDIQHAKDVSMLFGEEVQAILQTNVSESIEFIMGVFSNQQILEIFLGVSFAMIICFFLFREVFNTNKINYRFLCVMIIFAAISTNVAGIGQSLGLPILNIAEGYQRSISQIKHFQELRKQNDTIRATKIGTGETYVIVIGESSNKRHTSAYGYFRDTTPWLKSLRQNNDAIFLENAYASYVHTVPSILNILTSANQYNQKSNFEAPSIIEVAKKAGFKTYWFSNQQRYGLGDNPLTTVAEESDFVYFTPKANLGVDGVLVDLLRDKLKRIDPNQNNIIIVHLLGSHEKYTSRLPEGYSTEFNETGVEYLGNIGKDQNFVNNVLNPYDATVKYTDENLNNIYATVKKAVPDLSAFVYIPDHGEDVFGQKMHDAARFNFEMARVPFVMLFSDKWKLANAVKYETLHQNKNEAFTSDLFFEYFMGIAGINSSEYDAKYDIGSKEYSINWDNAITMWTDKNLQSQFYSKSYPHKLSDDQEYIKKKNITWLNMQNDDNRYLAVACDSVGAAFESLNDGFNGIEVNITVKQDSIQMGHGPEYVLNMTLDKFLSQIPLEKVKKIWLDMKLEDPSLIKNVFLQLEILDKKYGLKDRVILESYLVSDDMKIFSDNGWNMTFYFLPRLAKIGVECPLVVFQTAENASGHNTPYNLTLEEQAQVNIYADKMAEVLTNQGAKNISFWEASYPFIEKDWIVNT